MSQCVATASFPALGSAREESAGHMAQSAAQYH